MTSGQQRQVAQSVHFPARPVRRSSGVHFGCPAPGYVTCIRKDWVRGDGGVVMGTHKWVRGDADWVRGDGVCYVAKIVYNASHILWQQWGREILLSFPPPVSFSVGLDSLAAHGASRLCSVGLAVWV